MMHREESQSNYGTISIHNNVIASIASVAANEIEGVKNIGTDLKSKLCYLLGKKTSAIKVDIDTGGYVSVEIPLVIKYGCNIPEISNKVQENVRLALEKMTNLSVKNINITVQGIEKD
ncbi:MAG: Asp23/Gls24 family envelope stress response protein [Candidatus Omnitrophota bacterium]